MAPPAASHYYSLSRRPAACRALFSRFNICTCEESQQRKKNMGLTALFCVCLLLFTLVPCICFAKDQIDDFSCAGATTTTTATMCRLGYYSAFKVKNTTTLPLQYYTYEEMDTTASSEYASLITGVGTDVQCLKSLENYMCAKHFPRCPVPRGGVSYLTVCKSVCELAVSDWRELH